jgi:hypothetical protein
MGREVRRMSARAYECNTEYEAPSPEGHNGGEEQTRWATAKDENTNVQRFVETYREESHFTEPKCSGTNSVLSKAERGAQNICSSEKQCRDRIVLQHLFQTKYIIDQHSLFSHKYLVTFLRTALLR